MPVFDVPKLYADGEDLTELQLDAVSEYLETALNTTKLDYQNIQSGGIVADNLAASAVTTSKLAIDAVTTAKMADGAVTTAKIVDNAVTFAKLAAALQAQLNPAGSIIAFGGASAPTGYLACDGSSVSTTTYATLYAAIGTAHGSAGAGLFNLPDYRGRFLRGVDGSAGRDADSGSRTAAATGGNSGNAVGSVQGEATKLPAAGFNITSSGAHYHHINSDYVIKTSGSTPLTVGGSSPRHYATSSDTVNTDTDGAHTHTVSGGDNETRPANAYVLWCIKT